MITDINELDLSKRYTYADYLTWQFDEMVELIQGKIYRMSPAPSKRHQQVSSSLLKNIFLHLESPQCQVFHAPFDVRLPLPPPLQKADKLNTVVQPDICVICDDAKLDAQGCNGAPDWIIEILSPATAKKDLSEKFSLYEHSGVKEYWVVHPAEGMVTPYLLDEHGQYQLLRKQPFAKGEMIPVGVLNFEINLSEVFL